MTADDASIGSSSSSSSSSSPPPPPPCVSTSTASNGTRRVSAPDAGSACATSVESTRSAAYLSHTVEHTDGPSIARSSSTSVCLIDAHRFDRTARASAPAVGVGCRRRRQTSLVRCDFSREPCTTATHDLTTWCAAAGAARVVGSARVWRAGVRDDVVRCMAWRGAAWRCARRVAARARDFDRRRDDGEAPHDNPCLRSRTDRRPPALRTRAK